MISFPHIFGFRIDFLLILVIYIGAIFLVAKKFNLSRNKIILLFTVLFVVPIVWFLVIAPLWMVSIVGDIKKANYCEIDTDCAKDYFDGLTCGSYVNKNEIRNIYDNLKLYHLLSFDYSGCMGGALSITPVCENKKCVGGKKY